MNTPRGTILDYVLDSQNDIRTLAEMAIRHREEQRLGTAFMPLFTESYKAAYVSMYEQRIHKAAVLYFDNVETQREFDEKYQTFDADIRAESAIYVDIVRGINSNPRQSMLGRLYAFRHSCYMEAINNVKSRLLTIYSQSG